MPSDHAGEGPVTTDRTANVGVLMKQQTARERTWALVVIMTIGLLLIAGMIIFVEKTDPFRNHFCSAKHKEECPNE